MCCKYRYRKKRRRGIVQNWGKTDCVGDANLIGVRPTRKDYFSYGRLQKGTVNARVTNAKKLTFRKVQSIHTELV